MKKSIRLFTAGRSPCVLPSKVSLREPKGTDAREPFAPPTTNGPPPFFSAVAKARSGGRVVTQRRSGRARQIDFCQRRVDDRPKKSNGGVGVVKSSSWGTIPKRVLELVIGCGAVRWVPQRTGTDDAVLFGWLVWRHVIGLVVSLWGKTAYHSV
jgi:hypothetical protein